MFIAFKEKGNFMEKQRLVEKFNKDWTNIDSITPIPIPLNESVIKLKEYNNPVNILGAFKLPIWKLGEKNLNGRTYSEELGRKIVQENAVTIALDTHPPDDYEPKIEDIIAISKNPSIENGILYAEAYFVDKKAYEKVQLSVDHGYFFEQSSSGLGNLSESGEVIVESYELERYFDILVSNSSYGVKFGKPNQIQFTEGIKEEGTIKVLEDLKKPLDKMGIEEKNFNLSMDRFIKEAEQIVDIEEKIKEFEALLEWCNDPYAEKIKEKIQDKLNILNENLKCLAREGKRVSMLEKQIDSYKHDVDDLSVNHEQESMKLKIAYTIINEQKEYGNNLKKLYAIETKKIKEMVKPEVYQKVILANRALQSQLIEMNEKCGKMISENTNIKTELLKLKTLNLQSSNNNKELDSRFYKYKEERKIENNRLRKIKSVKKKNNIKKDIIEKQQKGTNLQQLSEIKRLYKRWYEIDPNIENIKDKIFECKTVMEASICKQKNKHLIEENFTANLCKVKLPTGIDQYEGFRLNDN
jgi:hypothetical protein